MVRVVDEEGLFLDVCSGGELAVALAAGFPAERIGFHGNNKSVSELSRALEAGVGRIVVDSFHEIERLTELARATGKRPTVLIRVTVGVEAHTHEFIATAHEDQKFGFSLAGGAALPAGARDGTNDWKQTGYRGPCPPIGRHRYVHKLYALDATLGDLGNPTKAALEKAIEGHVLGRAELIGTYQKSSR